MLIVIFLILVVTAGLIFYAFKIEPYEITLKTVALNDENEQAQVVKLVQLTDIHIKADFSADNLTKIIALANAQTPDIVLFTGDLYDNYSKYNEDEALIQQLSMLNANVAKIAVWGNRDYGGGAREHYENLMRAVGFTVLTNAHDIVTVGAKKLLFTGLDDSMLGTPDVPPRTGAFAQADYKILLTHEPDTIENYRMLDYDIALAGHSHGGQINIPFLPFVNDAARKTTDLASIYAAGMYDLGEDGIKKLYVNTGIGTTHLSVRFGVVPEVTLFNIYVS
jgi:hypothetical protein